MPSLVDNEEGSGIQKPTIRRLFIPQVVKHTSPKELMQKNKERDSSTKKRDTSITRDSEAYRVEGSKGKTDMSQRDVYKKGSDKGSLLIDKRSDR